MTIDRRRRVATLYGAALNLSPLLFELLAALVERSGEVASRAELKAVLWPYAARIDTERRLNTAVRALRVALGDDGDEPRFVATVRSHGYRWIAVNDSKRKRATCWAAAATAAFAAVLVPNLDTEPKAPNMALVEARAAVDSWRDEPTGANLARVTASVERAGSAAEVPAIHLLQAELALEARWDWKAADDHYRRALALDPDNLDAKLGLAWLRVNRGETGRVLELVGALTASSALTPERRSNLGWLLIRMGRSDLAADMCRATARSSLNILSCGHMANAALGRFDDATAIGLDLMLRVGASPEALRRVREGRAAQGYHRFLEWRARHFLPSDAPWFQQAQVLADAGHHDEALAALSRSVAAAEPLAVRIGSSPSFGALRSDARFRRLAGRVGLDL